MIKDKKLMSEFEDGELKKEKLSYPDALNIFEALWQEGVNLGVLPLKNDMEGIEADINLARILNSCSKNL
ncbi:MAG: hypothetical protein M1536_05180 [Firmicutes bacterium]|nr:hypothetical protein [Bacillota bacterium]